MMDFQDAMALMQGEDGIKQMLLKEAFENEEYDHSFSQADLVADVVNGQRMDVKRIADAVGVDISIQQMTPERGAELLQGVTKGDAEGLIKVFDEIEQKQMRILYELEGMDAVEEHCTVKQHLMESVPEDQPTVVPEIPAEDEDED
jgi:hypothetical protein